MRRINISIVESWNRGTGVEGQAGWLARAVRCSIAGYNNTINGTSFRLVDFPARNYCRTV